MKQWRTAGLHYTEFYHVHLRVLFCCTLHSPLHKNQHLVNIDDSTHVGSATASFKEIVTVARYNSTKQTADTLGRESATTSFGIGNCYPGVRTPQLAMPIPTPTQK